MRCGVSLCLLYNPLGAVLVSGWKGHFSSPTVQISRIPYTPWGNIWTMENQMETTIV